ncbi:hypothetical protein DFJ63DRAFT_339084 [Scheffersomyces coipomensis]|uniref:uncharacterized protein n=1 Tax=Scheffersomyces coipomensis TaxID=1788519 RepID=UPI00315D7CE2
MKQRITSLDLQLLSSEFQHAVLNYRLQNIYNVADSPRQYLLKFSIPDSKKVLVLDCGNKIHLTDFDRPTMQAPSNFVTKLRKHLKTRRLSKIKQIGNDRVLVLEFSDGLFYLVFEFFSAGNILLLDEERKILSLHRTVNEKGEVERYAVNEFYNMFDKESLESNAHYEPVTYQSSDVNKWIKDHKLKLEENTSDKKNKVFSIHKLSFVNASHLSSDLIKKNFIEGGIDATSSCLIFEDDESKLEELATLLNFTEGQYAELLNDKESNNIKRYIVSKRNNYYDPETNDKSREFLYDEFHPYRPYKENIDDFRFTEIEGYNKTLDTFFSALESSKNSSRIEQQKQNANKRLEVAKSERDKQIQSLLDQQTVNFKKGETIIHYADLANSCIRYIQKLIDQQMDWTNMESFIKLDQRRKNAIAASIKLPLNLKENKINILFPDFELEEDSNSSDASDSDSSSESDEEEDEEDDDDDDDDERSSKAKKSSKNAQQSSKISIWVDLALSPYANARLYFDTKKTAETKQLKVEKNTTMALKNAERKILNDLAKNLKNENEVLRHIRPKYWFEKFYWFVTSEGYLCLAGRDGSQNDMIYYRYFSDNDFFISSDVPGSLKVFVRNPYKGSTIPPKTLMQASSFALSASTAWDNKASMSAWFLPGSSISKRDFDGSLLSTGEFNYKSNKEYLPPIQLVLGFGFFILTDEATSAKYKEKREEREKDHGLNIVVDNKKKDVEELIARIKLTPEDDDEEEIVDTNREDSNKLDDVTHEEETKVLDPEAVIESTPEISDDNSSRSASVEPTQPDAEVSNLSESIGGLSVSGNKKLAPKVRGRKAKLKKMAKKYADQDDEERLLRMSALGTLKQSDDLNKQKLLEIEKQKELEKNKYKETLAVQRRKKQDEKELLRYINEEANEDESSVTNYLEILDYFLDKPNTGDSIVDVVPVFGPWTALQKLKYKVKIQPGSGKKGKCVNDSINYFTTRKLDESATDGDLDWENEREIVKAKKTNDLVGVFTVSKVKLVLPNGGTETNKKRNQNPTSKKGKKK